jgi:hypothetical protein
VLQGLRIGLASIIARGLISKPIKKQYLVKIDKCLENKKQYLVKINKCLESLM